MLATIGSMRMFLEPLFKVLARDCAPGNFHAITGPFVEWYTHRRHFVVPYALTRLVDLVLCSHPNL